MTTDLRQSFAGALEQVGGTTHVVADLPGARALIATLCNAAAISTAVAWETPLLAGLDLSPLFDWYRTPEHGAGPATLKAACAQAGVGITTAALAAADTGTLLLPFGPTRPRSVLILPPVWIAVVPAARLLPGRAELFANMGELARSGHPPAEMGLVTGPSKTADIESILLHGMHGPGTAHVIFVDTVDAGLSEL